MTLDGATVGTRIKVIAGENAGSWQRITGRTGVVREITKHPEWPLVVFLDDDGPWLNLKPEECAAIDDCASPSRPQPHTGSTGASVMARAAAGGERGAVEMRQERKVQHNR